MVTTWSDLSVRMHMVAIHCVEPWQGQLPSEGTARVG